MLMWQTLVFATTIEICNWFDDVTIKVFHAYIETN